MDTHEQESRRLLTTSISSTSSLVFLQLFSRLGTFALNQLLVRLASPQTFGTASIQFELLLSTILFLSREGVRNALLRSKRDKTSQGQMVSNIALLPIVMGVPASCVFSCIYVTMSSSTTRSQPYFELSVAIYAFAASIELLSEPLYIRAQNDLRFDIRVRAEGIAVFVKTTATYLVLAFGKPEWALLAFAIGQAAYGAGTLATFVHTYGLRGIYKFQRAIISSGETERAILFDPGLIRLARAMTLQSVIKHGLTEGDKFLISHLSPLEDQGGYAIASNYGSLVARVVFQPIEEMSRVFFSKALASAEGEGEDSKKTLRTASSLLMTLLLLFTHLFLILATFAPPYLPLAASIFLPRRYIATSAPKILGVYVYYIPTMAFNGILEAFFSSACTPAELRKQSTMMSFATAGFIALSVALSRGFGLGDIGLVWANIANLAVRALYAWNFARRYFAARGLRSSVSPSLAMPPVHVLNVFAVAAAVTRWSAQTHVHVSLTLMAQKLHIAVGIACAGVSAVVCAILEHVKFLETTKILRSR